MGSTAVESVKTLLQVDRSNYDGFEKDRIVAQNFAWDATIPQTKLPLMSYSSKPAKQKTEGAILKQGRSQYLQMLLTAQAGSEMTEKVFGNESNQFPP